MSIHVEFLLQKSGYKSDFKSEIYFTYYSKKYQKAAKIIITFNSFYVFYIFN